MVFEFEEEPGVIIGFSRMEKWWVCKNYSVVVALSEIDLPDDASETELINRAKGIAAKKVRLADEGIAVSHDFTELEAVGPLQFQDLDFEEGDLHFAEEPEDQTPG